MLDFKVVNSFLQGIDKVCEAFFSKNIKVGKMYIKEPEFSGDDVLIFVGITGAYKGQSIISMKVDTAKELAKKMMGGFGATQSDELDSLAKSAISELANMIMGKSSAFLEMNNCYINITTPTLLMGKDIMINNSQKSQNICIPINIDEYSFEFSVFLSKV